MICQRIKPAPALLGYSKEFLLLHVRFTGGRSPPVKAYPVNPGEGMTFHIRGTLEASTSGQAEKEKRAMCTVFGQPLHRQNLFLPEEFLMVHVRFQPGTLHKLLGIPMSEMLHKNIYATLIWGNEIMETIEKNGPHKPVRRPHCHPYGFPDRQDKKSKNQVYAL